jgi:hypothetical protein
VFDYSTFVLRILINSGVGLLISAETLEVVVCLFQDGEEQHHNQWRNIGKQKTDLKNRHELRQIYSQLKEIKKQLELVEQHYR